MSSSSPMEKLLQVIRFLAEPFDKTCGQCGAGKVDSVQTADSMESLWLKMCEKVWNIIKISSTCEARINHPESSSSWKLTCTILEVLKQLKSQVDEIEENQTEEENTIETLSVQSQLCVAKCLELVVGFGILPYLIPGVGIPNKFRNTNADTTNAIAADSQARQFVQFQRLSHCIEYMIMLSTHDSFRVLIIPHHLNDILSGLIQICKAPIKVPCAIIQKPETSQGGSAGGLTVEEFASAKSVRETLEFLMVETFSPLVSRQLWVRSLILIGAVQKPKWFRVECNKILYEALLDEKSGLMTLSQSVLDILSNSSKWAATKVISNVVNSAYVDLNNEGDDAVLTNLSKQILNMITLSLKQGRLCEAEMEIWWLRIALCCGFTLTSLNKEKNHQHIWDLLFKPVLRLNEFSSGKMLTYSTVEEVERCIYVAIELIKYGCPVGETFEVSDYQPLWSLLFQILAATSRYLHLNDRRSPTSSIVLRLNTYIHVFMVNLVQVAMKNVSETATMSIRDFFVDLMVRQTDVLKFMEIKCCEMDGDDLLESTAGSWKILSRCQPRSGSVVMTTDVDVLRESCAVLVEDILLTSQFKDSQMIQDLLNQLVLSDPQETAEDIKVKMANISIKATEEGSSKDRNARKSSVEEVEAKTNYMQEALRVAANTVFVISSLMNSLGGDDDIMNKFLKEQQDDPFKFLNMLMTRSSMLSTGSESIDLKGTMAHVIATLEYLCEATCEFNKGDEGDVFKNNDKWQRLECFLPQLERILKYSSGLSTSMTCSAQNILKCIKSRGKYYDFSGRTKKETLVELSAYKNALVDVESPLVHMKGHGLLTLRKLLEENDEETLEQEENLLAIFQTELNHDDSYVYLMAIEGMAALGFRFHKVVVPILINLYDFPTWGAPIEGQECGAASSSRGSDRRSNMTDDELVEYRLKVGEILVKLIQKLGGEIAPLYRGPVTNVCFRLVRDEDPVIKASALANLGELCYILKVALGNILVEVWGYVENMLQTEKVVIVRRAGYHLMVLLLRGIAKDLEVEFLVQNRDVGVYLRDARRLLSDKKKTETDEASKFHIDLALEELYVIAAKFFMIRPQTSK